MLFNPIREFPRRGIRRLPPARRSAARHRQEKVFQKCFGADLNRFEFKNRHFSHTFFAEHALIEKDG
jgi:hypothetical protein